MSKNTFFHTRFWQDNYVSDLDPLEKLMFVYALTSPYLGLTGIYETPIKHIAFETGLDKDMVLKIFARFAEESKIIYHKGWLCVVKYPKYQSFKGEKLLIAVEKEIARIPKDILEVFTTAGYPIDTLSIPSRERERERGKEMEVKPESKVPDFDDDFLSFWKAYPKKIGKEVAEKSWNKMKPSLTEVLEAIEVHKKTDQWSKDNGKYIPHPATWLNQKRWEDEVVTKSSIAHEVLEVFDLFDNPSKSTWHLKEIEKIATTALLEKFGLDTIKKRMRIIKKESEKKDPYFPVINTPSQLLDKMPNVERYLNI